MKILVTGGAGYIGSHTVAVLKEKGHEAVIYDNLSTGHKWAAKDCELVIGDINDEKKLSALLDRFAFDGVIHFAASSLVGESVSSPAKYYENNVAGSMYLFNTLLKKGVKNLVFSSTCATYGIPLQVPIGENEKQEPVNPYGWTKLMIERMLRDYSKAYGQKAIALRYFNAAGGAPEWGLGEAHEPESHVIPLLLQSVMGKRSEFSLFGNDYDTPDGSCIRDYIHVLDLASAHVAAMERLCFQSSNEGGSFDCFNLGTGKGVSVSELAAVVEKVTGKTVPLKLCDRREGDPPILVADNKKATELLKWVPTHSEIENIVKSAYEWDMIRAGSK